MKSGFVKILIVDLGSKFNEFGGQARMAAILNKKLAKYFRTYYLGYRTAYTNGIRNPIFMERKKGELSIRRSGISEMWAPRFIYNLFVVHGMADLDKGFLLNKVREIKPDVIIANSIQDINLLRLFKKKGLAFKSVYIDHGSVSTGISRYLSKEGIPLTVGTGVDSLTVSQKKSKFFNFYDVNVVLNHNQLNRICDFTDKVSLIQNGMDIKPGKNAARERKLRKRYGIDAGDFVVLYIGRMFDRQKNVGLLIRAFRGIKETHLKLLLVGDGPSLESYKRLAEGDGRIIFAGSVGDDETSSIYNISSLFVLPSFWEGFSLTVLEAASHSLPLVLSKNAYIDDLKGNGIGEIKSFDPNSEAEFRDVIIEFYKNRSNLARAISASVRISETFTEKRMIEKYRDLLEKLA